MTIERAMYVYWFVGAVILASLKWWRPQAWLAVAVGVAYVFSGAVLSLMLERRRRRAIASKPSTGGPDL